MRKPGKRDRHGFRGVPPPSTIDLNTLPDSAPLTDFEVAAILRVSTNTTASWRQRGLHLEWFTLPGGLVRSTVGAVKKFLAMGKARARTSDSSPPATKLKAAHKSSRRSLQCRADQPAASESSERTMP